MFMPLKDLLKYSQNTEYPEFISSDRRAMSGDCLLVTLLCEGLSGGAPNQVIKCNTPFCVDNRYSYRWNWDFGQRAGASGALFIRNIAVLNSRRIWHVSMR